jgi:hypothetical protein
MVRNINTIPDVRKWDAVAIFWLITGLSCVAAHLYTLSIYPSSLCVVQRIKLHNKSRSSSKLHNFKLWEHSVNCKVILGQLMVNGISPGACLSIKHCNIFCTAGALIFKSTLQVLYDSPVYCGLCLNITVAYNSLRSWLKSYEGLSEV